MKQHNLFYGSSYDRGLDVLLFMWPDVLEKYPDAELHIAYGWDLFEATNSTNPERMQWMSSVSAMMKQKGITHHGRVGKQKLEKIRKECGIWAYPTYFTEINCITALEAQKDGLVPVTMNYAALQETVGSGVKVDGDIKVLDVQEKYLEELLKMMGDTKKWQEEVKKGKEFAKTYNWSGISVTWVEEFLKPVSTPLVSVITCTNREGFWNLMAHNLSQQSYQKIEWIIVDDYKENRAELASKYANKYNLTIHYIHGDKATGKYKRKHGLVRSNNLGWKKAKGELLVYLQDFIVIPERGIEDLVDIYRHNPTCLIAPTDTHYEIVQPDFTDKEDWFGGVMDIFLEETWSNVRNTYDGLRKTENPYDFEMNYGAIPKKVLDHLGGFYELLDDGDGLGYDNVDIASRALRLGYDILIDDTNRARCADLDPYFPHTTADANKALFEQIEDLDPVRSEK